MKNILVPTDFSACAAFAAEAAIDLAVIYNAQVHLFHCISSSRSWAGLSQTDKEGSSEYQRQIKNVKILLKEWEEKAKEKNVLLTSSYKDGNLLKNIENIVKDLSINAIVMGSYGASGKNEFFIGSNTQKVVRSVHCPVFIIKNEFKPAEIKNVLYASNFDIKELPVFKRFLQIIEPFDPTIHLVQINISSWIQQPFALVKELIKDFADLCPPGKCKQYFYKDYSVDAGIRHFADELDVDLSVISNQQRSPLKRIFQGSNVEALVNHSERPVLSLDFTAEKLNA